jgi:DNA polymerase-3 subunit epsilon
MRQVVLDTETTGLSPGGGDRIVEIGCAELVHGVPSGRTYQQYINPERDVPEEVVAVHGLREDFLSGHPPFADIVEEFLEFLDDSPLVIHNAEFDMGFLNAELKRVGRPLLPLTRAIDTVRLARQKFPGTPANLDALCRRFEIDITGRTLHGALKDSILLAQVYLELTGGRQADLALADPARRQGLATATATQRPARPHAPSAAEAAAHDRFVEEKLVKPVWRD